MTSKNNKALKDIYIPIEIKDRELFSRVSLASHLVSRGFRCILGDKPSIYKYMLHNPGGIYFDKSMASNKSKLFYKVVSGLSAHIVATDEELGISNDKIENFFEHRTSKSSFKYISQFYCVGERDYDYLRDRFDNSEKIFLTGSPRIESWSNAANSKYYNNLAKRIRDEHGDYFLVNSSFGLTSVKYINERIEIYLQLGIIDEDKTESMHKEMMLRYKEFLEFSKIINKVSKLIPDTKFIVRPHPNEIIDDWRSLINSSNVEIIREGSSTPWIMASKCLIHAGCTTAIEALLLSKPVISVDYDKLSKVSKSKKYLSGIGLQGIDSAESLLSALSDLDSVKKIMVERMHDWENKIFSVGKSSSLIADLVFMLDSKNSKKVRAYRKLLSWILLIWNKRNALSKKNKNAKIPHGIKIKDIDTMLEDFTNESEGLGSIKTSIHQPSSAVILEKKLN